jgi:S1-C subfamily serine protease
MNMNLTRTLVASTLSAALLASSVTATAAAARGHESPAALPATSQVARTTAETSTEDDWSGIVLIETTLADGEAAGTGLVIDSSGLVLTNHHVVEGSTSVVVTLATTGETYDAEVVGSDQQSDIALLRLTGASDVETVTLDDDGGPAVADTVTAVGNADGQGFLSTSSGRVVALEQSIATSTERLSGLIQADAAVVGGYSGGALLDGEGEVVGITTAASTGGAPEAYAIPVEDALAVAEQIESGVESGSVEIGAAAYLGVGLVGTPVGPGVAAVEGGTAAAAAGLTVGDVLLAIDGRPVGSLEVLRSALAAHEPGDRATLRWRSADGTTRRATVTLGSSPTA